MPAIIVRSARINKIGGNDVVTLRVKVDRSLASAGGPGAAGVVATGAITLLGDSYVLPGLTLYSTYNAADLVTQGAIYTAELLDSLGNLVAYLPGFDAFQLRVPNTQTTWNEIRQQNDFLRQTPGAPPPGSPSWLGDDTDPTTIPAVVTILGGDTQAGQDTINLLFGNSDNPPGFRTDVVTGLMQYSNDGITWFPFTGGGGALSGSGTANYLAMWTGVSTLGDSPAFYDSGAQTVIVQNNLAAEKNFSLGTDQFVFNGDPSRVINVVQATIKGVAGQTGDFLRITDDANTALFRVRTLGNVTIRGLNYAWPSSNAVGVLTNDGAGNLTWTPGGGGGGITSLNGLTAAVQTFVNDTNVTIVSAGSTQTITWAGTLAKARQNAATVYNDQANAYSSGLQDFTSASGLRIPTVLAPNPTTNGLIGYDTTNHWLRLGANSVARIVPYLAGTDSGGSTANAFARFTSDGTLQASPLAYDTGTLTLFGVDNAAFNKQLTLGTDQIILNGNPARVVGDVQTTIKGVAGQTGDFLRITDDANTALFRVRTLGNVTIRGLNYAWPSANAVGVLTNDGSGNLTWTPGAGGTTFTVAGDSGTPQTIGNGDTLTLAGGNGLTSVASATDTITFNLDLAPAQAGVNNALSIISGQLYAAVARWTVGDEDGTTRLLDCSAGDTLNIIGGASDTITTNLAALDIELDVNIAPAQSGIPNYLSAIAGQGLYVIPREFKTVRAVSANTALNPTTDNVIIVNTSGGNVTVTLNTPSATDPRDFHIKKRTTDANSITLTPASGQIDGGANFTFNGVIGTAGESRHIVWDGTNWWIL